MSALILKDNIISALDAIPFSTEEGNDNDVKSLTELTRVIDEYIKNNCVFVGIANGTYITPPSIPVPLLLNPVTVNMFVTAHNADSLKSVWESSVKNGLASGGIQRMFQAIATYISSPPIQVMFTPAGALTLITPQNPLPIVPIVFPQMAIQGVTCESEVLATSFPEDPTEAKEKSWEIIAKHIHIALSANVIIPAPTVGLVGAFPFSGITTTILTFP